MFRAGAVLAVLAAAAYVALRGTTDSDAPGLPRAAFADHPAWTGSVALSFPGARPVPEVMFNASADGFAALLMEARQPVVVCGSPVVSWPAMRSWTDARHLARLLGGRIAVHTPREPVVRIHHSDQPFESFANWSRPFREAAVSVTELLRGDRLYYAMLSSGAARDLLAEVSVEHLSVPWRAPLEVNVWLGGASGITTPAHYDMVHNMYAQVVGYKRFVLFPPADGFHLYPFTNLHPSARQTQVDFFNETNGARFPNTSKLRPLEVVLAPGQVLYIPPFFFHQVSVVTPPEAAQGERGAVSVSVSVHTSCPEVELRSALIDMSLALPVGKEWTKERRVCALYWHFAGVFVDREERTTFLRAMLQASFSHFDLDESNAPGLHRRIREARRRFPAQLQCGSDPDAELRPFAISGQRVRQMAKSAASLAVTTILMNSYVQDCAELLLGALDVDPFLRGLAGM